MRMLRPVRRLGKQKHSLLSWGTKFSSQQQKKTTHQVALRVPHSYHSKHTHTHIHTHFCWIPDTNLTSVAGLWLMVVSDTTLPHSRQNDLDTDT